MIQQIIRTQTTATTYIAPWHLSQPLHLIAKRRQSLWLKAAQSWGWSRANALNSHHARPWAKAVTVAMMPTQPDCPF